MRDRAPTIADTCADKTVYDTAAIIVKKIIEIDRDTRVRSNRVFLWPLCVNGIVSLVWTCARAEKIDTIVKQCVHFFYLWKHNTILIRTCKFLTLQPDYRNLLVPVRRKVLVFVVSSTCCILKHFICWNYLLQFHSEIREVSFDHHLI